jgi:hypothetical protein
LHAGTKSEQFGQRPTRYIIGTYILPTEEAQRSKEEPVIDKQMFDALLKFIHPTRSDCRDIHVGNRIASSIL